jgi:hypothetical protein
MYNWSKEWLVDFNPKKTECIMCIKDCTHYCGAHVQVKTMETSCEVVLS